MPPSRHNDPSPPAYPNATTNSVRRNLFSAHLSRRDRPTSSQSHPQPQPQPQSQSQSQSHPQSQSSTSNQSQPQPPPPPQRTLHSSSQNLSNTTTTASTAAAVPAAAAAAAAAASATSTLFPSNSIIALHPITGRPILPTLPSLPAHLRLSSDDSDPELHPDHDPDAPSADYTHSSSYWASMDDQEREDKERIEKSLVEMMYRQRKRGQSRSRRGKERDNIGDECHGRGSRDGGMGMGSIESEELLGLVMASLRKKVVVLEEERWMFEGGAESGGGLGIGVGGAEPAEMSSNRYN